MLNIQALFGESPFKPLQAHMDHVSVCTTDMQLAFAALMDGDRDALEAAAADLNRHEASADTVKNQLRAHLPRLLLLPVARRDLLEVLDHQDSIADATQAAVLALVEYPLLVPQAVVAPLRAQIDASVQAVQDVHKLVQTLDELVEAGFGGPRADSILQAIESCMGHADVAEAAASTVRRALLAEGVDAVSLVWWLRVLDQVVEVAEQTKKVANRARLFLAS